MWWWTTSCCSSRGPQWSEDWLLFAGHMLTSWLSTTQFNPLVTMMNTCASRQDININVSGHFTEIHGTIWIYRMRSFPHLSQFIMMFTWQDLYTDGCTFGQELCLRAWFQHHGEQTRSDTWEEVNRLRPASCTSPCTRHAVHFSCVSHKHNLLRTYYITVIHARTVKNHGWQHMF